MNKGVLASACKEINFQDVDLSRELLKEIERKIREPLRIMEVCGTHTRSIFKYGIDKLLPENLSLISGPGCPVCVTPVGYIDNAIELSKKEDVIIVTFGDLLRVPGGSGKSLSRERAEGARIQVVYSPLDSLKMAEDNSNKEIVFLGVGFETTAPTIALMLKEAKERKLKNLAVLLSLKTMPSAMEKLILNHDISLDGFICPGHVASIIGTKEFNSLSEKHQIPMAVCGFEPVDILGGILSIIEAIDQKEYQCKNRYSRVVREGGNLSAMRVLQEVFHPGKAIWRGLGSIDGSGLVMRKAYEDFDAELKYSLKPVDEKEINGCICGEILKGKKVPRQCSLYKVKCTPQTPVGPCMVSSEGTCGIAYDFGES